MGATDILAAVLAPPTCAACGRLGVGGGLCSPCARRFAESRPVRGVGPPGTDFAWSSALHQGVARDLVAALKFRRLLSVAELMAERIERLAPAAARGGTIVPVPTARRRTFSRGFDPALEIAARLAERSGLALECACLRRVGGGRQVGRRRAERLGRPPRVEAVAESPRSVLLLDDVLTTGASVSACARALRSAGAARVVAVTFTRRM